MTKEDQREYQASLKAYRDNYAVIQTERADVRAEERQKSFRLMLSFGIPAESIAASYGMSVDLVMSLSAQC